MNKLFLTQLAAALPAAAEVELYGNIRLGVEAVHSSRPSGSETTAAVRDFGSYVGIKGRIPLGSQAAGISAGRSTASAAAPPVRHTVRMHGVSRTERKRGKTACRSGQGGLNFVETLFSDGLRLANRACGHRGGIR